MYTPKRKPKFIRQIICLFKGHDYGKPRIRKTWPTNNNNVIRREMLRHCHRCDHNEIKEEFIRRGY